MNMFGISQKKYIWYIDKVYLLKLIFTNMFISCLWVFTYDATCQIERLFGTAWFHCNEIQLLKVRDGAIGVQWHIHLVAFYYHFSFEFDLSSMHNYK